MLVIRRIGGSKKFTKLLTNCYYEKTQDSITDNCQRVHTSSAVNLGHNHNRKSHEKISLKIHDAANIHKCHSGIAAGIVDSAPSKVQPYLRLMRIDKPIGKYKI